MDLHTLVRRIAVLMKFHHLGGGWSSRPFRFGIFMSLISSNRDMQMQPIRTSHALSQKPNCYSYQNGCNTDHLYFIFLSVPTYPARVWTTLSFADPNLTPIIFFIWLKIITITAAWVNPLTTGTDMKFMRNPAKKSRVYNSSWDICTTVRRTPYARTWTT